MQAAAVAGFVALLAVAMAAGVWFALRDARTAALALEELTEKPLARVEGADSGSGYSAYSVQPPAVVEAVLAGAVTSASLASAGSSKAPGGAPAAGADGYVKTSFKVLAGFEYGAKPGEDADAATSASVGAGRFLPPEVLALDGRKVSVTGFMMPIDFEDGRVRSFLLMKNQLLCCFGIAPRLNDFVAVQVGEGRGVPAVQDVPITVKGILQVGEVSENGAALAVYTMIADDVKAGKQAQ